MARRRRRRKPIERYFRMDNREGLEVNRINPNNRVSGDDHYVAMLNNEHVTLGEDTGYKRVGIVKRIGKVNRHRSLHFSCYKEYVNGE